MKVLWKMSGFDEVLLMESGLKGFVKSRLEAGSLAKSGPCLGNGNENSSDSYTTGRPPTNKLFPCFRRSNCKEHTTF